MRLFKLTYTVTLLLYTSIATATIIRVPQDQPTIQEGIDSAFAGDTVLVDTGKYIENINFNGKNIVVASLFLTTNDTSYLSQTVIDGDSVGSVVTFESGEDTTAMLSGFRITNGWARYGGGIYCSSSSPSLVDLIINGNSVRRGGGGIYCSNSNPHFIGISISNNSSEHGGGIYLHQSSPYFDNENRCIIYFNRAFSGNDLYSDDSSTIEVVLDTFTVMNPTNYHASPRDNFIFDILHAKIEQKNSNLYVSPVGNDSNNGQSPSDPLQSISFSLSKIFADSLQSHTIFITNGVYSPSITGENFPLTMVSHVSLSGESKDNVILDAEGKSGVMYFDCVNGITVENITITKGLHYECDGIYCNKSSPRLVNLLVTENYGRGIYCENYSSPSLQNITISRNTGGGIYCREYSSPILSNVIISENIVNVISGGGIYCKDNCNLVLSNVIVSGNRAGAVGGGIYCWNESNPILSNVTISGNTARMSGGGLHFRNARPTFDDENRCNIYLNHSSLGSDLYSDNTNTIAVIVDTFTVMNPTNYHASPLNNFTFDILHTKLEQVESDLYVDPSGDDANGGQSPSDPLRNISTALYKIIADSLHPRTIHLSEGIYSPLTIDEHFPLFMASHVSISGESEDNVILNAENQGNVIYFRGVEGMTVENLTITGGQGSGIYCEYSKPNLHNVTVTENNGVGINCDGACRDDRPGPSLENVTVTENSGTGIKCFTSNVNMKNVTIRDNKSEYGAGISIDESNPKLENVTICGNSANYEGGGMVIAWDSNPTLVNVTVNGNTASQGGGIWCTDNCFPTLINSILWNNSPEEIYFYEGNWSCNITIAYSDIQGGEDGIVTNDNGMVNWLDGNINADPLFVNPEKGNYKLRKGSPCIDTGTSFFVWEGDTLVNLPDTVFEGDAPDMGAFESTYSLVVAENGIIPIQYALKQNFPNPFNPTTTIEFSIPQSGFVTLTIYDVLGREVETILNEYKDIGHHKLQWNASEVPSGIYFMRMQNGDFSQVRKVMVVR